MTWPTKCDFEIMGSCVQQVLNVTWSSCELKFSLIMHNIEGALLIKGEAFVWGLQYEQH